MSSNLFKPISIGNASLQHRVVLAPLTRYRASEAHVPTLPLMKEYYEQRACRPGTLLITEGTFIALKAGGKDNVPGIWNAEQIAAWKEVGCLLAHNRGCLMSDVDYRCCSRQRKPHLSSALGSRSWCGRSDIESRWLSIRFCFRCPTHRHA